MHFVNDKAPPVTSLAITARVHVTLALILGLWSPHSQVSLLKGHQALLHLVTQSPALQPAESACEN